MSNPQLSQEIIPASEAACIQDLAARLKAKIVEQYPSGPMRRDAHPKMHGVVKAEFIVEPGLPKELQVGVFSRPGTYRAWIRFSNANATAQADNERDLRGMAIKLMGVPGAKLLEQEKDEQTQDFLLVTASAFLARDVEEFDAFVACMDGNLWAKIVFFLFHLRFLWNVFKSMKQCANVLQTRYWSTTPYAFGDTAAKYSAIPRGPLTEAMPDNPAEDFLRASMISQLDKGEALFDFAVQLQTDAKAMPIEDPTREWDETVSPFRKVATLRILQQEFDGETQRTFGENLSFTPWHSLPAHRPLGGINRARKVVYEIISSFRHEKNGVPRKEPAGWDI
jgi:hypothetical protein